MISLDKTFTSDAGVSGGGTADYNVDCEGDLIIVAIYVNQSAAAGTIDNPKFNGVAFTQLFSDATLQQLYVGYLKNPDQGTHQFHTIFQGGSPSIFRSAGIILKGTKASPIGGTASSVTQTAATPNSLTVTVQGAAGMVIDFLFLNKSSADASVGSGQTSFADYFANDNTTVVEARASYEAHTGSDTVMDWTGINCPSSTWQMHYAVEILPAPFIPQVQIL